MTQHQDILTLRLQKVTLNILYGTSTPWFPCRVRGSADPARAEIMELSRVADRMLKTKIITVLVPRLPLSAVEGLRYPAQV